MTNPYLSELFDAIERVREARQAAAQARVGVEDPEDYLYDEDKVVERAMKRLNDVFNSAVTHVIEKHEDQKERDSYED
jgi:hypothetical protein